MKADIKVVNFIILTKLRHSRIGEVLQNLIRREISLNVDLRSFHGQMHFIIFECR